jgi:tRNA pseudouridine55 synthase
MTASCSRDGLVVIDKPAGWTSHDVVARVRRLSGTRKVGHAGTLDPMATGILVLGVNRATRLLTYLVGVGKTYEATIRLGVSTITDDAEGDVIDRLDASAVDADAVREGTRALTGELMQVPSSVSAVKIDGKRAYARVRAGEQVELTARPITVSRFEVRAVRAGEDCGVGVVDVDVEVDCSSGTYVRALARDLGRSLGVGGHLTALRRTRVGPYALDVARTLEQLESSFEVLPLAEAARAAFPARELTEEEAWRLGHGQRLKATGLGEQPAAAFAPDGRLVAIVSEKGPTALPLLVLQD